MTPLQSDPPAVPLTKQWSAFAEDIAAALETAQQQTLLPDMDDKLKDYRLAVIELERAVNIPISQADLDALTSRSTPENPASLPSAKDRTTERERLLGMAFGSRETLEIRINAATHLDGPQLLSIAALDTRLREAATRVLRSQYVDMTLWRKVRTNNQLGGWWWQLDREIFGLVDTRTLSFQSTLYLVIALALFLLSLGAIFETAGTLGRLVLRTFQFVSADDLGVDVITIVGVAAQLVLGGGIAYRSTRRTSNGLNQFLATRKGVVRPIAVRLLPLSRFLVGTIIFVSLIFFTRYIALPELSRQLELQNTLIEQPIGSQKEFLDTQNLLDPSRDYAAELARLGLRAEQIGDLEDARQLYEQSLSSAPNLIVAWYRLADLNTRQYANDPTQQRAVIVSLDSTLRTLEQFRNQTDGAITLENLRLREANDAIRYQVLLLTIRARAFYNIGEMEAALFDLREAEDLVESNSALFITPANKDDDLPRRVRITELYYLAARANTQLYEETGVNRRRNEANRYWDAVLQIANPNLGSERMWSLEAQPQNRP